MIAKLSVSFKQNIYSRVSEALLLTATDEMSLLTAMVNCSPSEGSQQQRTLADFADVTSVDFFPRANDCGYW
jgi:hypothetical protein